MVGDIEGIDVEGVVGGVVENDRVVGGVLSDVEEGGGVFEIDGGGELDR